MHNCFFDLSTIGATNEVYESLQPFTARGLILARVSVVYREQYRLLTASDSPLGGRDSVTWAEVGQIPLCRAVDSAKPASLKCVKRWGSHCHPRS